MCKAISVESGSSVITERASIDEDNDDARASLAAIDGDDWSLLGALYLKIGFADGKNRTQWRLVLTSVAAAFVVIGAWLDCTVSH